MSEPTLRAYAPGATAQPGEYAAGDFILVHHNNLVGWIIRFGQRLRYRGKNRKFSWANHAGLIVSDSGDLYEATGTGIKANHLSEYTPDDYIIVRPGYNPEDVAEGLAFAQSVLNQKYGYIQILCIAIGLLTGTKLTFGYQGHMVCSGYVTLYLIRGTFEPTRDAADMTPADLAYAFGAVPPVTGAA